MEWWFNYVLYVFFRSISRRWYDKAQGSSHLGYCEIGIEVGNGWFGAKPQVECMCACKLIVYLFSCNACQWM